MGKYKFVEEFYRKNNGNGIYPYVNGVIEGIVENEGLSDKQKVAEIQKVFAVKEKLVRESRSADT